MINLFTIGFTRKKAEQFFGLLSASGVRTIVDTRLHNESQLAGFAKKDDLTFFARRLIDADYVHWEESAPTEELLGAYRRKTISWEKYETNYRELLSARQIESSPIVQQLNYSCLLCSEDKPHRCHRRLLAEYLREKLPTEVQITHLT